MKKRIMNTIEITDKNTELLFALEKIMCDMYDTLIETPIFMGSHNASCISWECYNLFCDRKLNILGTEKESTEFKIRETDMLIREMNKFYEKINKKEKKSTMNNYDVTEKIEKYLIDLVELKKSGKKIEDQEDPVKEVVESNGLSFDIDISSEFCHEMKNKVKQASEGKHYVYMSDLILRSDLLMLFNSADTKKLLSLAFIINEKKKDLDEYTDVITISEFIHYLDVLELIKLEEETPYTLEQLNTIMDTLKNIAVGKLKDRLSGFVSPNYDCSFKYDMSNAAYNYYYKYMEHDVFAAFDKLGLGDIYSKLLHPIMDDIAQGHVTVGMILDYINSFVPTVDDGIE